MAYVRRDVTDGVTVMNKDLYDNLQDGIDESKEDLDNVKESVSDVEDQVTELENQVDTATEIAKGRNRAKVFSTTEKMQEWLSNSENKNLCSVGDNLYIVDVGVPDWWVAEVFNEVDQETGYYYKIAQLETQKVDLTTIEEEIEYINESLEEQPQFVYNENGQITGYKTKTGGADTVFPFSSSLKMPYLGLVEETYASHTCMKILGYSKISIGSLQMSNESNETSFFAVSDINNTSNIIYKRTKGTSLTNVEIDISSYEGVVIDLYTARPNIYGGSMYIKLTDIEFR